MRGCEAGHKGLSRHHLGCVGVARSPVPGTSHIDCVQTAPGAATRAGDSRVTVPGQCRGWGPVGPGHAQQGLVCPSEPHKKAGLKHLMMTGEIH